MVLFTLNVSKSYRILFAQRGWTRLLKACLCRFELISFEKAASCAVRMLHWTLPLSPLTPCKSCYDEVYVHFLLSIPRQCVLRSINSPVSTGDGVEEGRNSLQPPAAPPNWLLCILLPCFHNVQHISYNLPK